MPSIALIAPVAISLATAGAVAICGVAGWKIDRIVLAAGTWLAIVALIALWAPVRSTQELGLGQLGFGTPSELRLDAVAFTFGLMVLVPAAILLTLQPRAWEGGTVAALGVAASVVAVESGGVILTAVAGGAAATLAIVQLDVEDPRAERPPWGVLVAAWLALAWVGAILQVRSGTAIYGAVPVSALTVPVFALLAGSALIASGLYPWRGWASHLWGRPALRSAGMAVATLYPLGFYLLVRAYEIGDGRFPQFWMQIALAGVGVLVAFGAAARAQGASTRRAYLGEVIPGLGGFALIGISVGNPLGLVAGIATLAVAAVLAVLATPAQAVVMPAPPGVSLGSVTSVVTVSTVLPAVALFTPVVLLAVLAYYYGRPMTVRAQARAAFVVLPGTDRLARLSEELRRATVPAQYRSLVDLRAIEAAATGGGPLLWLAALVALAFAVTR